MKRAILLFVAAVMLLCGLPVSRAASVDGGYTEAVRLLTEQLGKPDEFTDDSGLFDALYMPEFNTRSASNFAVFDMQNLAIYVGGKLGGSETRLALWQNVSYQTIASMGRLILDHYGDISEKSRGTFAFGAYDRAKSFYADTGGEASLGRLTYDGLFAGGGERTNAGAALPGAPSASAQTYVGNRNTKKFHYPWCRSVDQMKDKNKVILESREEAIQKGYVPCKNCNP